MLPVMLVSAALALWPDGWAAQQAPSYLSWAASGPYIAPDYADFSLRPFRSDQPIVGTSALGMWRQHCTMLQEAIWLFSDKI